MNSMFVTGNLTRDPKLSNVNTAKGAMSVVDVDVAINKTKKGENVPVYYRFTAWGKQAEVLAKYAKKGMKMTFETDSPEVQTYEKKDGTTGYTLVAQIEKFEFPAKGNSSDAAPAATPAANEASDDPLPF